MENLSAKKTSPSSPTLFWSIVWIVAYLAALLFLKKFDLAQALGYAIAVATVLPFAAFLWHFIHDLRRADELERQVQLEALAVAFPLSVLGMMLLGLLELVAPLSPDNWSFRHLLPFFFTAYLLGLVLARRRYDIR